MEFKRASFFLKLININLKIYNQSTYTKNFSKPHVLDMNNEHERESKEETVG